MAEVIPNNSILLPNRLLISESAPGSCIGTIVAKGEPSWGPFKEDFTTQKVISPENVIEYTTVIFKRANALEITVGGVNYLVIHCDDVMGFVPPA